MPYLLYSCNNPDCEHEFEEFYLSMNDVVEQEPKVACPKCDSTDKEKLISKSSFQLQGRKWASKDGY